MMIEEIRLLYLFEKIIYGRTSDIFPLDINGYHFESWSDAERQLGIAASCMITRAKKGKPLDIVFGFEKPQSLFPLDINGYHFESWADASRQLGINHTRMEKRFELGWPLNEIFEFKEHRNKNRSDIFPLDINGYHFESWADASMKLGKTPTCYMNRFRKGFSLNQVFGFEKIEYGKPSDIFPLDINGYHFESWADAERQLGIKSSTLAKRLSDGFSLEQVFGFEKIEKRSTYKIFPLDIHGYHFISWNDAGKQIGIRPDTLISRYKNNWSLEEIFGFKFKIVPNNYCRIGDLVYKKTISNDLYIFIDKNTKIKSIYTYDQLNEMWLKEKGFIHE